MELNYPRNSESPELLFKYPVSTLPEFYFVDGDCVVVSDTLAWARINDILYDHLYAYERYTPPITTDYLVYLIKPETIGIISEFEFTLTGFGRSMDLVAYSVQNDGLVITQNGILPHQREIHFSPQGLLNVNPTLRTRLSP